MQAVPFRVDVTDSPAQSDLDAVDAGLDASNHAAADLGAVRPLAVFARDAGGRLIGGLRARRWGRSAEIQQLWVEPAQRRHGVGGALLQAAETALRAHGCVSVYLETFSWQAPRLYARHGYVVAAEFGGFPDGGVKYVMHKALGPEGALAPRT